MDKLEHRRAVDALRNYEGSESYLVTIQVLETKVDELLEALLQADDYNEIVRLQGAIREVKGLLRLIQGNTKMRADLNGYTNAH